MSIDPQQASAMLADVDIVVRRVKQSRIYRRTGDIFILWGALQIACLVLFAIFPVFASIGWFSVDLIGVAGTLWMLRGVAPDGGAIWGRVLGAFLLFYGFGYVWAHVFGAMAGRQLAAFWPTLFQFGYALAGLWFGAAFLIIGVGAALATVAAFIWAGEAYGVATSLINGGVLIVAGLWMRRA